MSLSIDEVCFKKPLRPAPKRNHKGQIILDEDNYTKKIESIIERDFYPSLSELHKQLASPSVTHSLSSNNDNVPLDTFLGAHTCEDDQSFADLLHTENERKRLANTAWICDKREREHNLTQRQLRLMTSQYAEQRSQCSLGTWTYRAHNELMYVPGGEQLSQRSHTEQRRIVLGNTRLDERVHSKALCEAAIRVRRCSSLASRRRLHAGVSGRVGVDGEALCDSVRRHGNEQLLPAAPATPCLQSPLMTWGTVEGTPLLLHDEQDTDTEEEIDVKQKYIGRMRTTGQQFYINHPSARESLAHSLVDRGRSKRSTRAPPGQRSLCSTPSVRQTSLSPAVSRLVSMHRRKGGSLGSVDKALRASYSPSVRRRRTPGRHSSSAHSSTRSDTYSSASTPCVSVRQREEEEGSGQNSGRSSTVTQLPANKCPVTTRTNNVASDFF